MNHYNVISFLGLFALMATAWVFSTNRRCLNGRLLVWGVLLQCLFGAFVFLLPLGARLFLRASDAVVRLLQAATEGSRFCFGILAAPVGEPGSLGFILAFQALPTIIFFAALMQILYYFGIMPFIVRQFARVFAKLMRVSGAEALCAASNIFVGIESATTVLPYLRKMTRSEVCVILTAGLATIASSLLGAYVLILKDTFPNIAGHLISASLLSAPAALVMAKLLVPETEQPETMGRVVEGYYERENSVIEAAIRGATAGGRLVLGIITMLVAFLGLMALVNLLLGLAGQWLNTWTGLDLNLRLENLLGYVFYPLTLVIGVPPADAMTVARLLGMRAILTEVPAYQQLSQLIAAGAFHDGRSVVLAAYALCGFSHVASIAIFVGGISALAPEQTGTLARVAARALLAATLACLMTAAVAGMFYGRGALLFALPH
jgi:CNT family concentrative nucleoside transporter